MASELYKRQAEAKSLIKKYPERVPVIVSAQEKSQLPKIGQTKFLVPRDMTVGKFVLLLRRRIDLDSMNSIFLFVEKDRKFTLIPCSDTMGEIYKMWKDEDEFLYIIYSNDSAFG